ncbi:Alpha/Beta hydrolase protein [Stachybotrys elegans]|uniref:Alpha/Beta hydrolase protein n=1 Tax=Stachybotrys elegans TaxID=80388 RepID=A0A8K0WV12_9HYPO|nr:Alpha/Beta hydrolase protein [Stachybotrys elegans]
MYEDGPNPTQLQSLPPGKKPGSVPPLVLLHDGGGTTFSYFLLGSLQRDVWAIHNPKFWDAGVWEGGVDEMARHYIKLMREAGITGEVYLGGWSLGGFLSLTISRFLADDPSHDIKVVGILIIDSPRQIPRKDVRSLTVGPQLSDIPDLVRKSFDNCDKMLEDWEVPSWDAPACEDKPVRIALGGKFMTIEPGTVLYKPLQGGWGLRPTKKYAFPQTTESPKAPPPAVLIRCTERSPKAVADSDKPAVVDFFRDEVLLGWEAAYPDFIKGVIDIEANHYNVFEKMNFARTDLVTSFLMEGLEILESIREPHRVAAMEFF